MNENKKAINAYYGISNTVVAKKEISNKTKMLIFQTVIALIVQYGTESIPLQDKHRSKMTAVEMKYLSRIVG